MSSSDTRRSKKKQKRGMSTGAKVAIFLVELIILAAAGVILYVTTRTTEAGKVEIAEEDIVSNDTVKQAEETTMKGYWNIALFGVDSRQDALTKNTRSDTIMIASINQDTGDIKLVSVYRDTYLNLGNDSYNKCNAAYAKGGPEQAIRMINMNTDMNVDDFITVDFDALEDIIDDLGGVEINVQPEEVDYINDYQFSIVMDLGGPNEGKIKNPRNFTAVTQPGPQTLNGLQATAYCRIRYTAGSDFRRTERQREVISQIVQKAKGASLKQLNDILNDVLPQITTSFSAAEFAEYASKVGNYTILETQGFPFENVTGKIGKQSMVVPDTLVTNVSEMHTFLFGPSAYSPTTNVQVISDKIEQDRSASGL